MKRFLCCLLFCFLNLVLFAQNQSKKEEWQSLFNGKDLTGWDIKIAGQPLNDNYKNTFLVQDGLMRVSYKEYDRFNDKYGHIYYKQPFSYYRVRFEYRFQGDQA